MPRVKGKPRKLQATAPRRSPRFLQAETPPLMRLRNTLNSRVESEGEREEDSDAQSADSVDPKNLQNPTEKKTPTAVTVTRRQRTKRRTVMQISADGVMRAQQDNILERVLDLLVRMEAETQQKRASERRDAPLLSREAETLANTFREAMENNTRQVEMVTTVFSKVMEAAMRQNNEVQQTLCQLLWRQHPRAARAEGDGRAEV